MKKRLLALLLGGVSAIAPFAVMAQEHGHLIVGSAGKQQNDPLIFDNGDDFIISSGYIQTLEKTDSTLFAGYYHGNLTLTALAATTQNSGPFPKAPAPGSFIRFGLACVSAPEGGSFAFWDADATAPSVSLAAGESSTNLWAVSQGDGSPGSDPYGHIHGRRFTATKPGVYQVEFTVFDTSTNGAGGAPIHTPSEPLPVWFQAGVSIYNVEPDELEQHVHVTYGAKAGFSWQVEYRSAFDALDPWMPAGDPVVGDDHFVAALHNGDPGVQRFYRVVGTPVVP